MEWALLFAEAERLYPEIAERIEKQRQDIKNGGTDDED